MENKNLIKWSPLFLILILVLSVAGGCRGKDGKIGGPGGSMEVIEGSSGGIIWGVQVDNFNEKDTINVYYSLSIEPDVYYQMVGPSSPGDSTPYYDFSSSGNGVLVYISNLTVGSFYRILVWRSI